MLRTFRHRVVLTLATCTLVAGGCSDRSSQITGTQLASAALRAHQAEQQPRDTVDGGASFRIAPKTMSLLVGDADSVVALFVNEAGTRPVDRGVSWASSNHNVAEITRDGVVTAHRKGSATISARWHGVKATMRVTVSEPAPPEAPDAPSDSTSTGGAPDSSSSTPPADTASPPKVDSTAATVVVSPASITLEVGAQGRLAAKVLNAAGSLLSGKTIAWSSSDPSVATVTSSGLVTAAGAGRANITARVGTVGGSAAITVSAPPPPPEPPTRTGSGSILSGALTFDNFSKYSTTQDLVSSANAGILYSLPKNTQLLHLDSNVRYAGHATMRYDQPALSSATPQLHVVLPNAVTNLWYRAKMRFSPGWSTKGSLSPAQTAEAYKIFGIGWTGAYDGRFTLDYTNTSEYEISLNLKDRNTGQHPILVYGHAGRAVSEWTDGQWYDVIVHVWQPTSTSYKAQFWLSPDGQTPVLRATITGTMSSGQAPAMGRIMLGMNFNDTRYADQNQSLWYGEWQLIDGSKHSNPFGLP